MPNPLPYSQVYLEIVVIMPKLISPFHQNPHHNIVIIIVIVTIVIVTIFTTNQRRRHLLSAMEGGAQGRQRESFGCVQVVTMMIIG